MTGVMNIPRCGTCRFAKVHGQDLTKRQCIGGPPGIVALQTAPGKITISSARPIVNVSDEACSFYQTRAAAVLTSVDEGTQSVPMPYMVKQ